MMGVSARSGKASRSGASASYSRDAAQALKNAAFDVDAIAAQGLGYERLDQLTTETLLGAR